MNSTLTVADFETTKKELRRKILKIRHDQSLDPPIQGLQIRARRIECECESQDILHWLRAQPNQCKIYWSSRNQTIHLGGVGIAHRIFSDSMDDLNQLNKITEFLASSNNNFRYFGGITFADAPNVDSPWKSFGSYQFVLPIFEMIQTSPGYTVFACNIVQNPDENLSTKIDTIIYELDKLKPCNNSPEYCLPSIQISSTESIPNSQQWNINVESLLGDLNKEKAKKVVLARKTIIHFSRDLDPLSITQCFRKHIRNNFLFCFQFNNQVAFLGIPPERLYRRKGEYIKIEAVAGTRRRGKNPIEDMAYEKELLNSAKDQREHSLVREQIVEELMNLCCYDITMTRPALLKLKHLQHIFQKIEARLPDKTSDFDLLIALHPTAAVGGYPTKAAKEFIKKYESFHRGWYSGPVGWLSKDESEFVVAIRSSFIEKNRLEFYSGAGIIKESNAKEEWDEVEQKYESFIQSLGQ